MYEKVKKALTNKMLQHGIQQASPSDQTSCLEGFHSVLSHFAPKTIGHSHPGMYVIHFSCILTLSCPDKMQSLLDEKKFCALGTAHYNMVVAPV